MPRSQTWTWINHTKKHTECTNIVDECRDRFCLRVVLALVACWRRANSLKIRVFILSTPALPVHWASTHDMTWFSSLLHLLTHSHSPIRRNWAPGPAELVNTNLAASISWSAVLTASYFTLSLRPSLSLIAKPPTPTPWSLSISLLHSHHSISRLWDSKIILRPCCWVMLDSIHVSHHNQHGCKR